MSIPNLSASAIVKLIVRHRFSLSDEKAMQADLVTVLTANEIPFEREKRLGPADVIDFLIAGGIGIECKLRGAQKMAVYKQLKRYAAYPDVAEIILVTNLSMGLPAEIEGKPTYYASLGRAWL